MTEIYRNKLTIMRKVLLTMSENKGIISIISRFSNLSHKSTSRYLELLYEKECVSKIAGSCYNNHVSYEYRITPRGFNLLKTLNEFLDRLNEFEFDI
jgi:predicted transcriptional regulator